MQPKGRSWKADGRGKLMAAAAHEYAMGLYPHEAQRIDPTPAKNVEDRGGRIAQARAQPFAGLDALGRGRGKRCGVQPGQVDDGRGDRTARALRESIGCSSVR